MLCYLLFTAIYAFSALAVAIPYPHSVTKVIIETHSVLGRQVTDPAAASITEPPSAASITDPAAASISSLISLLVAPSSVIAQLTNIPAPVISLFEGLDVLVAYNAIMSGADWVQPWINSVPPSQLSWLGSQASKAATIIPQIISLQSVEISDYMVTLSASASLSNQTFTATFSEYLTVVTTTAFPAPTHVYQKTSSGSGLSMGSRIGLSLGIPGGVWLVLVLIMLFFHFRRNRSPIHAGELHNGPVTQEADAQSPVIPFPDHNEPNSTAGITFVHSDGNEPVELVEVVDDNGVSSYIQVAAHARKMAEDSLKYFSVTNEAGEPLYQPSARNSVGGMDAPQVIKRKPVGSVSSHRVVSMEGIQTSEQVGTTAGVGGDESKKEDEAFADAVKVLAATIIGEHKQQGSPNGRQEMADAKAVEDGEKKTSSHSQDKTEQVGIAK